MPSQKQTVIDDGIKEVTAPKTYGTRVQANLNACFSSSPLYATEGKLFNDQERHNTYQHLLDSDVTSNYTSITGEAIPGGPGLGMNSFDTDFSNNGVPDINSLEEVPDDNGNMIPIGGGAGAPTTPYVPPLTSPGDGNGADVTQQGAFDFENGVAPKIAEEWGPGNGLANPSISSNLMDNQTLLGTYISGRSFAGSRSVSRGDEETS